MLLPSRLGCVCVIGTRPEAIKMAPVIRQLARSTWIRPITVTTGQQGDLLDTALADFGISPDCHLPYEASEGGLASSLSRIVSSLDRILGELAPECVIGQGDTTSALAASIAAFYRKIPFVHVEAGLRSADLGSPFPEEYHRRMIAVTAALNCAPTAMAAEYLRRENVPEKSIHITGNTVIDALLQTAGSKPAAPVDFPDVPRPILLTAHRRENFGAPMREALLAIRTFVDRNPDTAVFFPVHPNPAARDIALATMCKHPRIILRDPLAYRDLVATIQRSWAVVTDSGGLQEEAPALGKPVLVLRDETERPEAVEAGVVRVVGTKRKSVLENLEDLTSKTTYSEMARPVFPYGDGRSAERIVHLLPSVLPASSGTTSIAS